MDNVIAASALIQAFTAIIIACATVFYAKLTNKLLQANIEPSVEVDISGTQQKNQITIENDSGCTIRDISVIISIGYMKDEEIFFARKSVFSKAWERKLKTGDVLSTESPAIQENELTDKGQILPTGVRVNIEDIIVDYSFIRDADSKRYCYQFRVGILVNPDGSFFYSRLGEPYPIRTLKRHILRLAKDEPDAAHNHNNIDIWQYTHNK